MQTTFSIQNEPMVAQGIDNHNSSNVGEPIDSSESSDEFDNFELPDKSSSEKRDNTMEFGNEPWDFL